MHDADDDDDDARTTGPPIPLDYTHIRNRPPPPAAKPASWVRRSLVFSLLMLSGVCYCQELPHFGIPPFDRIAYPVLWVLCAPVLSTINEVRLPTWQIVALVPGNSLLYGAAVGGLVEFVRLVRRM
jgi:hypothetical protein